MCISNMYKQPAFLTQSSLGFCHKGHLQWGYVWARWWVKADQTAWCLWSFQHAWSVAPWNIQASSSSHCPPPEPHTCREHQRKYTQDTHINCSHSAKSLTFQRRQPLTQRCHLFPWFGWGHHPVYKFYGTYDCKHLPPPSTKSKEKISKKYH